MLRYGPGIWDFHPDIDARYATLTHAKWAAKEVPSTIEVRIYRCHGGNLIRVQ